jgi:hypothetical protein
MLKRTLIMAMISLALGAPCRGSNLTAQIFPLTGEIRLRNTGASAVPLVFYSITSPSGALNSSALVWKSITDFYDVSGNGFIDPAVNWTKISSTSMELTEGVFSGVGGSLAAFRSVSLGHIWNSALYPAHDLSISAFQPDTQAITISVVPALAGDYNNGGGVGPLDYQIWRQNFGSTTNLDADGNLNGIVDAADYAIWRNNLGLLIGAGSGSGSGSGLLLGGAVPEPASAFLLLSAAGALLTARVRVRRAARRATNRSSARR